MTKTRQSGQLLDLIAAALTSNGYEALMRYPDQVERGIRKALEDTGVIYLFSKLRISVINNDVTHILHSAPRQRSTNYSRWRLDSTTDLPRCELFFNTTPEDVFRGLAETLGAQPNTWKDCADQLIQLLEEADPNPLVRINESLEAVRSRVRSRE